MKGQPWFSIDVTAVTFKSRHWNINLLSFEHERDTAQGWRRYKERKQGDIDALPALYVS